MRTGLGGDDDFSRVQNEQIRLLSSRLTAGQREHLANESESINLKEAFRVP